MEVLFFQMEILFFRRQFTEGKDPKIKILESLSKKGLKG